MKRTILFSLLTLVACGSMQASTINFGYGENGDPTNTSNGNVANTSARSWTTNGITVTVQAFTLLNGAFVAADTTQFGVAQSSNNNLGIGVCNAQEIAAQGGCGFNEWQIDDHSPGGDDFLMFTFSQNVTITNLKIQQTSFSADSDVAYWASNTLATTPNTNMALTFDAGGTLNVNQSRTLLPVPGIVGIRSFLVGADGTDNNADYFKLVSLDVTASTAPEPGTMVLLGSGLLALGAFSRRKKA